MYTARAASAARRHSVSDTPYVHGTESRQHRNAPPRLQLCVSKDQSVAGSAGGGRGGIEGCTCHAVAMVGTAPPLIASTYAVASPASMPPVTTWLPSLLGCALEKMSSVRCSRPCRTAAQQQDSLGREGGQYQHPHSVCTRGNPFIILSYSSNVCGFIKAAGTVDRAPAGTRAAAEMQARSPGSAAGARR